MKCERKFWVAEVLLKFYVKEKHNLPRNYHRFCNLRQFTKIYVSDFVPRQFWWIADFGFNGLRHIFIQIFVQVDPHVDYTIWFCG